MKTIVVPTDYTGTSSQVIDYAAQLALQTKAQLILYHAFFEPYAVTEAPVEAPTNVVDLYHIELLEEKLQRIKQN